MGSLMPKNIALLKGSFSTEGRDLVYSYGSSVLINFLKALNPSNILIELVQNEYDAGGHRVEASFGRHQLIVRGNGNPVDSGGWARLSVMLGTGYAPGLQKNIDAKTDGIGSLNYGLKSLFLYGDQILVRSNGKEALLDLKEGADRKAQSEHTSRGKKGIKIVIPFRTTPFSSLKPFDVNEEAKALDAFAGNMSNILMELGDPIGKKSLDVVTVNSVRCKRTLRWKQYAKIFHSKMRGVSVIQRRILFMDSSVKRTRTLSELEFQKNIPIPNQFVEENIPNYYRVTRRQIRIGLSFRISMGKPDYNKMGIFFYPLGIPRGFTGSPLSVNAPFQLNSDRSNILDVNSSSSPSSISAFPFRSLRGVWRGGDCSPGK